jgi:hypothetical protein
MSNLYGRGESPARRLVRTRVDQFIANADLHG